MVRILIPVVLSFSAASLCLAAVFIEQYTEWSQPVNVGPGANSSATEFGATVSRDGLSLYFHSDRPGGFGGTDVWVSQRTTGEDTWGPAQNLGPFVNTEFNENTPKLSRDGHRLYFASDRPSGFGGSDVYVSRRRHERDDLSWNMAINVGSGVNGPFNEGGPAPFENDATGTMTLFFFSPRPGGLGLADIYASTLVGDTFGPAVLITELSSVGADIAPEIRQDGLEILITSNRPGSMPFPPPTIGNSFDLWVSSRNSTGASWFAPTNLGAPINSNGNDGWGALSFKATILYFSTRRPGALGITSLDLYQSVRSKLK
jgi:hypothetical protein